MKLCGSHQTDLAAALRKKGLWKLCSTDPHISAVRAQRWLAGVAMREEFDPLVVATLEINSKAKEILHPAIAETQHLCPLCQASKALQRVDIPAAWIDNCTDMMFLVAKTNGLVAALH
jgi:hypothetical protein